MYRAFELLPMPIKYPDAVMAERIVLDKIELLVVTPKGSIFYYYTILIAKKVPINVTNTSFIVISTNSR